eukprot:GHVU01039645.1.p1 GENE.GHVU01039645.1~~GHVU01039645.1.p1  ORF type:complete len:177 (-),score=15.20 GHVU01039645.1:226-756(-)
MPRSVQPAITYYGMMILASGFVVPVAAAAATAIVSVWATNAWRLLRYLRESGTPPPLPPSIPPSFIPSLPPSLTLLQKDSDLKKPKQGSTASKRSNQHRLLHRGYSIPTEYSSYHLSPGGTARALNTEPSDIAAQDESKRKHKVPSTEQTTTAVAVAPYSCRVPICQTAKATNGVG